jgi:two-component system, NarL family, nitrate/nitrite response regulator NarL
MTKAIGVYLVCKGKIFREGLVKLMSGTGFAVRAEAESIGEAVERFSGQLQLKRSVLLTEFPQHDPADIGQLKSFGDGNGSPWRVVIAPRMERDWLIKSLAAGASAFVLKDTSFDALLQSLRLVVAGEKVFPSELAMLLVNGWSDDDERVPDLKALSDREQEVLRSLILGYSNKVIARELRIAEATVKVHLRAVLRKLNLRNRTQAALWAASNGFSRGAELPLNGATALPQPS